MKQAISPEVNQQKPDRPKPKKFRCPTRLSFPVTPNSALRTILDAILHPIKSFRILHDERAVRNGALMSDPEYRARWSPSIAEYVHWYFADKRMMHSISWLGVPTRKMLPDMWVYQEIIHECRPDYIIEIGSLFGGSALFMANVCDLLGHGNIISIDISRDNYRVSHPRIVELTGDCSSAQIVDKVKEIVGDHHVMLIHDADHRREAVSRDLNLYAQFVTPGQYLVIEDGVVDVFSPLHSRMAQSFHDGGPLLAARSFLEGHPDLFELDTTRERFILTSNPKGYLRRKPTPSASL